MTLQQTITAGLGYCCNWYFFQLFKDNEVVAERLGFAAESVRKCRKRSAACAERDNCMAASIAPALERLRKLKECGK